MNCHGCNTIVSKDQERCASCGFPLKILNGNCDDFAGLSADYQNEWLKYHEEMNLTASSKSIIPFFGVFYGIRSIILSKQGFKNASLIKKQDLANRFNYIRRLAIFGLVTNLLAFIFIIIGIIGLFRTT